MNIARCPHQLYLQYTFARAGASERRSLSAAPPGHAPPAQGGVHHCTCLPVASSPGTLWSLRSGMASYTAVTALPRRAPVASPRKPT